MTQPSNSIADLLAWAKSRNLVDEFNKPTKYGAETFAARKAQPYQSDAQSRLLNTAAAGKLSNENFSDQQSRITQATAERTPVVLNALRGQSDIRGDEQERRVGLLRNQLIDPQGKRETDLYMAGIGPGGLADRLMASDERKYAQALASQEKANNRNSVQNLIGNILKAGSMILPFALS